MDGYHEGRKSKLREEAVRLEGLSPDKYGKAAYQQNQYTPSKLADNVIFKQVTALKKYQQTAQKYRDLEQTHSLLIDKYEKALKEKAGIQETLTTQLSMYKNLLAETQDSAEERLQEAQKRTKQNIAQMLKEKNNEIKFVQAEKEELEGVVEQLQEIGNKLETCLNQCEQKLSEVVNKNEALQTEISSLKQKIEQAEEKFIEAVNKNENLIDDLRQKAVEAESIWRDKMDIALKEKDKEQKIKDQQFKEYLKEFQQQKEKIRLEGKNEIKELTNNFEKEIKRVNEILSQRQNTIENLQQKLNDKINQNNCAVRGYEQEVINLAQEKALLFKEYDDLAAQNTRLNTFLSELNIRFNEQKHSYETKIGILQQKLEFSEGNFLGERERNNFSLKKVSKHNENDENINTTVIHLKEKQKQIKKLNKEIKIFKQQNLRLNRLASDNGITCEQNQKLRQALAQSSLQVERCKQEFIKLGQERDILQLRLEEETLQNGTLRKIKGEKQAEARTWKKSYLLTHR